MEKSSPSSRVLKTPEGLIDVYEPQNHNGGTLVYLHGFAELNKCNVMLFANLANSGTRVLSPCIAAGQSRKSILQRAIATDEFRDSDPENRAVMPHSAGSLAFAEDLTNEEIAKLSEEVHSLIFSNIPLDAKLTLPKLVSRFVISALQDTYRRRSISHLTREIADIIRWGWEGNIFDEVSRISTNQLHKNFGPLAAQFGSRIKVLIDSHNDYLTPAQPVIDLVRQLPEGPNGKPHIIEVSHGHSPSISVPYHLAILIRDIQKMSVRLRQAKKLITA